MRELRQVRTGAWVIPT